MLSAGKYHTLTVSRISDYGLYLADADGNEVLLPNRFVSLADKVGDAKEVFVYHDSEDRIVASTERPYAAVGEVAVLKVVDKNQHGAFLDWGLKAKDLFVPNRNMRFEMRIGDRYPVYLYEDSRTGRAVATTKLNDFVSNDNITVRPGQKVHIVVAQASDQGFRVVVENANWGMVYRNQIFRPVSVGDEMEGFVARITEDKRIDISLQQAGYVGVQDSAEELLAIIEEHGGTLPVGDDSDPEQIRKLTRMSKKSFKRAAGYLMKRGDVTIDATEIKLMK